MKILNGIPIATLSVAGIIDAIQYDASNRLSQRTECMGDFIGLGTTPPNHQQAEVGQREQVRGVADRQHGRGVDDDQVRAHPEFLEQLRQLR